MSGDKPRNPAVKPASTRDGGNAEGRPRPAAADGGTGSPGGIDRRDFLKVAGAQAGLLMVGPAALGASVPAEQGGTPRGGPGYPAPALIGKTFDTVVIGAGAFGGWTAYWLKRMGQKKVLVVDAYGPGNTRSTSGDETRGVRTSYGDRPHGELWMRWASRAMGHWRTWDDEWGKDLKMRLFYTTGDFIFRTEWENFTKTTRDLFVKVGIRHEVVPVEDVRKAYPVIRLDDITVCLHEPDAGVVRARRATQCVSEVFLDKLGGQMVIARAYPSMARNGKMDELILDTHDTVSAGQYVFACGPWLGKVFPSVMGNRLRTPIGQVCYFATPLGDNRFTYPNLPTYNFPGVTGWPTLPPDSRGFRVRGGSGGPGRGGGRQSGGGPPPQIIIGGPTQDPDLSDRWVDQPSQQRSRNFLAERFPLLKDAPINGTHACHYETSLTRNFIFDHHPDMSNVWIAGAGSAEGFKFGPVVGEYLANRLLGHDKEPELVDGFRVPKDTFEGIVTPAPASKQGEEYPGDEEF